MSCKLTSIHTPRWTQCVRSSLQHAIIVPLQAQMIFPRDATEPVIPYLLRVSLTISA